MIQEIKDEIIEGSPKYNITDNADGTKNIELANEIIQEGTPLNKTFFENFKSDISDYELLSCEQEDISEPTTSSIFGQLPSSISGNDTTINGYCLGNQDGTTWDFKIEASHPIILGKDYVNNKITLYGKENGSTTTNLNSINNNLIRTSYNSSYRVSFMSNVLDSCYVQLVWDFKTLVTPTFNAYINSLNNILYGSTDGNTWETITTITNRSNFSFEITTPYRYFKLYSPRNSSSGNINLDIHYAYFSNVGDSIKKIKNNFASTNNFSKFKCKNVLVPSDIDMQYVTSNTLNGIDIDKILQPSMRYNIMLEDGKMINGLGIIDVVKGSLSNGASVTLDFIPRLIMYNTTSGSAINNIYFAKPTGKTFTNPGIGLITYYMFH